MQNFKGDELETKMIACAESTLDELSLQKDSFFESAFDSEPLGDVIYDGNHSPLANAIKKSIFRYSFNDIYSSFEVAGSFESYLSVFRKIFGDDVDVQFTIPGPGKLEIDIVASELVVDNILGRTIVNNEYVFDEIIDYDGENLVGQSVKGFQTEYELNQMLFEMVPGGIFTQITLSFEE